MSGALLETVRVREGRAPFLDRHEARLRRSGIEHVSLKDIIAPHLPARDVVVRIEVALGHSVTTRPVPAAGRLRVILARTPHAPYPRKTTDRAVFDAALAEARADGADDAVLLTVGGIVAEGTVWNLFWWEGKELVTPPLDLGILPGIARGRVCELQAVRERAVGPSELRGRSLFATNAVRGVIEIATLDGVATPRDARTAALATRFWP